MPPLPDDLAAFDALSRRRFLARLARLAGAGLALPGLALPGLAALPAAARRRLVRRTRQPVRVAGRVATPGGAALAGVRVSDGRRVTRTDADGRYALATTAAQPFVFASVPAGHAVPQNDPGTARFYRPLPPDAAGALTADFTFAPLPGGDARHRVLVLADPQTQTPAEMDALHATTVPAVQAVLQAAPDVPTVGVANGDIMFDDLSLYPAYERAVGRMGVPFFQVVGNHDLDVEAHADPGSTATFRRHFGPTYYSFDRGAVRYVVLDDVFWLGNDGYGYATDDYLGYLDAAQLAWLEQDLADAAPGQPVVVFLHIPVFSTRFERQGEDRPSARGAVRNRAALYDLLAPFDAHVVAGHTHENEHRYADGPHEHVVGTVCGAWWSGPICYDGTPSGFAVYDVDGTDVRWRYQATGQPADYQMRLYAPGADPAAPDELVANVWDADDGWTVTWFEDGVRKGPMARRLGTDPLSVELHRGADVPAKRPWVEPVPTRHLFYAPVAPDARRLRVDATDRFGRTYTATHDVERDS